MTPIERLKASPEYPQIRVVLESFPEWEDSGERVLEMTLSYALAGPRVHERFTKTERVKTAEKISALATELAQLLYRVHGNNELGRDWPFELQGAMDYMALSAALDFRESAGGELAETLADDDGDAFHATRYGIYHVLMECMPETLESLADAAQYWKEAGSQPLAKPNHKNAARLYFIRAVTGHFVRMYGRPLRELTLSLTSVYFDCGDLDTAALSNLAPVTEKMKRFYEMDKKWRNAKLSQVREKQ